MQPASRGGIFNGIADGHGEGDDIVFHACFQLVNTGDIHFGTRAYRGSGLFRDLACFGQGLRGGKLDFQPLGELVGVAPNVAHLLACVAWYQCLLHKNRKRLRGQFPVFPCSMIPQMRKSARRVGFPIRCPKMG